MLPQSPPKTDKPDQRPKIAVGCAALMILPCLVAVAIGDLTREPPQRPAWTKGGTLNQANLKEFFEATSSNQEATAAVWYAREFNTFPSYDTASRVIKCMDIYKRFDSDLEPAADMFQWCLIKLEIKHIYR